MGIRLPNSTSYVHPDESNQLELHRAMDYNEQGQPIIRTSTSYNWTINISAGNVPYTSYVEKFGRNTTLSGNVETVWDGNNLYTYITSASRLSVVSDSGDDAAGGTGARTVEIQGLDGDYNLITETITVGGADTTTNSFLRVFRARVATAGSVGTNVGILDVTADDSSTVLAKINKVGTGGGAGLGQTFMALYTIPAGKTAYLTQWTVGAGGQNADTSAFFLARPQGGAWNAKDIIVSAGQQFAKNYQIPLQFTEKTDLEVRAFSSSAGNDCASSFNLILIDNDQT